MSTPNEVLNIVGDMADKIKNNVKQQVQQFSWKLTFPKEVVVDDIPAERIMILNKQTKRLRTEFVVYPRENAILVSPQTPYKPDEEYFFWAKYKKKEICIAFTVSEDHELKTSDQKASIEKLNQNLKRAAAKAKKAAPQIEPQEEEESPEE